MLRLALSDALAYILSTWFIAVFALIVLSGISFLGVLIYHLVI
ncbi:MAG: hypothetical protein ACYC2T_06880 [Bacillota bacterium]